VSLIELLSVTLIITCGFLLGHSLGQRWGMTGWLVGIPMGIALGFLPLLGLVAAGKVYHRYRPLRPICRQGKCGAEAYSVIKITPQGWSFRCRCGDMYLSKGYRFGELLPDGSVRPYMVRAPFRDWKPDLG
jgi:hypothetical protein